MVAAKGSEADAVVSRPPKSASAFLVYGPDAGLVSERSARLLRALGGSDDPLSVMKLDAGAVASDPNRLAEEVYALSLFGGRRIIVVRDGGSRPSLVDALRPILTDMPPETALVVDAGDLGKSHPLRSLFERDRSALSIPCYADDTASLLRLVDDELKSAGLSIVPDARHLLADLLGGDRLISRSELEKLCLYAAGRGKVTVEDVEDVVGDASSIGVIEVADAVASGDLAGLGSRLARAYAEGLTPDAIAGAALRHFQMLDRARAAVDGGETAAAVVDAIRPPVFYKRRDKVLGALQLWSAPRLARALRRLAETAREVRISSHLKVEVLGDTLFTLARAVSRK